jgi:hypothetical protein
MDSNSLAADSTKNFGVCPTVVAAPGVPTILEPLQGIINCATMFRVNSHLLASCQHLFSELLRLHHQGSELTLNSHHIPSLGFLQQSYPVLFPITLLTPCSADHTLP